MKKLVLLSLLGTLILTGCGNKPAVQDNSNTQNSNPGGNIVQTSTGANNGTGACEATGDQTCKVNLEATGVNDSIGTSSQSNTSGSEDPDTQEIKNTLNELLDEPASTGTDTK